MLQDDVRDRAAEQGFVRLVRTSGTSAANFLALSDTLNHL